MDLALTALPFLVFLACPVMMLFCVVGMRKMGCSSPRTKEAQTAAPSREVRVAALEGQLATVQSELAALRGGNGQPIPDRSAWPIPPETEVVPQVTGGVRQPA